LTALRIIRASAPRQPSSIALEPAGFRGAEILIDKSRNRRVFDSNECVVQT
jgi:hypothetical protein